VKLRTLHRAGFSDNAALQGIRACRLNLIQRNARAVASPYRCVHLSMEHPMTLDTIMALIAVTVMFATIAIVLGWENHKAHRP
jgi:hypothetical protein